jgi:hypothetical protein
MTVSKSAITSQATAAFSKRFMRMASALLTLASNNRSVALSWVGVGEAIL